MAKKSAGDLVSHAPPNINPASIAKSNRSRIIAKYAKMKVQIPNIESMLSTKLNLSKKKVKGETA